MIYYLVFSVSSLFIWLSTFFENRDRFIRHLFAFIAISTLSILAAVRDTSVGTDTVNYNNFFYAIETSKNLVSYSTSLSKIYGIEYGFSVFNYIIGMFVNNVHIYYFICEFIISLNIYLSISMISRNISTVNTTLGWITYCLMFYTLTFNILRQSIALSFILLAVSLLICSKYLCSFLLIVIACLFHKSSIFAFLIYLLGMDIKVIHTGWLKKFLGLIYVLVIGFMPVIIQLLNSVGIMGDKYSQYLGTTTQTSLLNTIGIRLPMIILLCFAFIKSRGNINKNSLFIYIIIISEFILLPFQSISAAVGRTLLCFGINKVIGYPIIISDLKLKSNIYENIMYIIYIVFLICVFYEQVILNNNNQVYPFVFAGN